MNINERVFSDVRKVSSEQGMTWDLINAGLSWTQREND